MTICVKCKTELVLDSGVQPDNQYAYDNALWIAFHGGYGMFVDNIDATLDGNYGVIKGADYELVLCHECAHAFFDHNPWLTEIVNPHDSHAHTTAYHKAHPDHKGWDYDKKE